MLGRKQLSRTFKTKEGQAGLVRVLLFWKSHCRLDFLLTRRQLSKSVRKRSVALMLLLVTHLFWLLFVFIAYIMLLFTSLK